MRTIRAIIPALVEAYDDVLKKLGCQRERDVKYHYKMRREDLKLRIFKTANYLDSFVKRTHLPSLLRLSARLNSQTSPLLSSAWTLVRSRFPSYADAVVI